MRDGMGRGETGLDGIGLGGDGVAGRVGEWRGLGGTLR